MTWDAYNRRKDVVREVMAIADRRLDGNDLYDEVPQAREVFASRSELLLELQMAWFQAVSGQVDRMLYVVVASPEDLVCDAWVAARALMPGTRAILDAHLDDPALQPALDKEARMLAVALGLPPGSPLALTEGRRVRELARSRPVPALEEAAAPTGLFARIREALAA